MKVKLKLTIAFLAITLIPLMYVSMVVLYNNEQTHTQDIVEHLNTIASLQEKRVEYVIEDNIAHLTIFSSRPSFLIELDKYNKNQTDASLEFLNAIVAGLNVAWFKEVHVLDPAGRVISSTDPRWIGTMHAGDDFFVKGRQQRDSSIVYKSDGADKNGELRLYLTGPLMLNGSLVGVIVFESDITPITEVTGDYTGLGETGEVLLVKRDTNGDTIFITPTRFDPGAALTRKVSKDRLDMPSVQALSKKDAVFLDAVNHRGRKVLAATRYIEQADWGLVVQMERSEAYSTFNRLKTVILIIAVITGILVVITGFIIAKTVSDPIEELTRVCGDISRGHLESEISPALKESTDEIGKLAVAFDRLIVSLKLAIRKTGLSVHAGSNGGVGLNNHEQHPKTERTQSQHVEKMQRTAQVQKEDAHKLLQVAKQQVAKQQIARQQVARQQVARQQVARQQVARQQVAEQKKQEALPARSLLKKTKR